MTCRGYEIKRTCPNGGTVPAYAWKGRENISQDNRWPSLSRGSNGAPPTHTHSLISTPAFSVLTPACQRFKEPQFCIMTYNGVTRVFKAPYQKSKWRLLSKRKFWTSESLNYLWGFLVFGPVIQDLLRAGNSFFFNNIPSSAHFAGLWTVPSEAAASLTSPS